MSDIPSFELNWNLDDPNIIGQNADAFKTIQETIARIKLIKEVGLANLYEKGVLLREPYCSVYDMVSAIKNIPIYDGKPRYLPFQYSLVNHSMIRDDIYAKVLSQSFTIFADCEKIKHSIIRDNDIKTSRQFLTSTAESFSMESDRPTELAVSTRNKSGNTIIAIIGYQVTDEELANNIRPYNIFSKDDQGNIFNDWKLIYQGNVGIRSANTGLTSKIDVYTKKSSVNKEICCVNNLIDRGACFDIIVPVNYVNKPIIGDINSLTEGQNFAIQKKEGEDTLWIEFSNFELDKDRVHITPDNINNFELNFSGNSIHSKISYNFDGDQLLKKNLTSDSNRIRSIINIILGGAEW